MTLSSWSRATVALAMSAVAVQGWAIYSLGGGPSHVSTRGVSSLGEFLSVLALVCAAQALRLAKRSQ